MPKTSVRRTFHGPVLTSDRPVRRPLLRPSLELVPEPPSAGALGQALLRAARDEQPGSAARQRILHSVLIALKRLTSGGD